MVAILPFVLLVGCQEEESGNLRESYERMIASAERQPAAEPPTAHIVENPPTTATPAAPGDSPPAAPAAPSALPIDTIFSGRHARAPEPEPAVEPVPPAARDAEPAAFEGTPGIQRRTRSGAAPGILRAVRTAEHPGFDRVVFQFDGSMPGYHIEYIDRPIRECGSGRTLPVAGQGWLRVRLDPARAHELVDGFAQATVASRNRPVDHNVVLQLALTCDFEARVEWVIGVTSPNRYRVLELTEPVRLVVDVLH
jgi:hypothetical protein